MIPGRLHVYRLLVTWPRQCRPAHLPRAFTLVELLVCMLLVTLVTVGVAQVFKLSQETVAVGQRLAEFNRDRRSARDTMQADGANWAKDAPVFYIVSRLENIPDSHGRAFQARRDRIAFPVRAAAISRVTGGNTSFIDAEVSGEAWVWYGHCDRSFTGDTVNRDPLLRRTPTNILGRVCLLMLDPNPNLRPPLIAPTSDYFPRTGVAGDLTPLSHITRSTRRSGESYPFGGGGYPLATGRYDLLGTTLALIDQDVQAKIAGLQGTQSPPPPDNPWITPNIGDWWSPLLRDATGWPLRFLACDKLTDPANPLGGPSSPPSSAGYAYTTPVFLRNATEFIVQFSVDVVAQDPVTGRIRLRKNEDGSDYRDANGLLQLMSPDLLPDFDVVTDGANRVLRQDVRWFGLNDSRYPAITVVEWLTARLHSQGINIADVDMTPLYFERGVSAEKGYDAAAFDSRGQLVPAPSGGMLPSTVWLWVRGAPRMLRIIFRQDDPDGLIREGQWTEFVIGPR